MTEFYLGQIFEDDYSEEASNFVDENGFTIVDIEPIDGVRRFQIVEVSKETEEERKKRIQELFMTRSDFFDCTIRAWRLREKELLVLIENLLAALPVDEIDKLVAVNNFENAQNFYRKHTLFSMIVIAPLKLSETTQVIITDEHLDKLFDEVAKGNKETAWQYLPQPELIPVEPEENILA